MTEAEALLSRHEQQHGATAETLYLNTRINIVQGRLRTALEAAATCQQQYPNHARCHEAKGESELIRLLLQGNVLTKIGAARQARHALERAVELDSDNMRARLLLIRFYTLAPWILGGSRSKASQLVEACQQRSEAWGHEAKALYALGIGDNATAVKSFARAQALLPRERDPALFLAKAYLADQQPRAAIRTLERLVEKYPRFQEAWLELGKIAADNNLQSVRGMAALEHYLANADGESGALRAQAATALARLYMNADRTEEAVTALRRARNDDPGNREARRLLSSICQSSSRACADDRSG